MKESAIKGQVTKLNKRLAALEPGEVLVKENLHNEVYHRSNGVSNSRLKTFLECPRKYQAKYLTGEIEQETVKAFDIGKGAHCAILEPQKFDDEFVKQPADIKVRRGKKWDEFKEQAGNKVILTSDDWDACYQMRDAVNKHYYGRRLLAGGKPEISYFKRDIETGLIIKCRPDYELGDMIVDVKTTVDASPAAFERHALKMLYHMQDAIYRDITGKDGFSFLAVEKAKPYIVTAPLYFDEDAARLGYLKYRRALNDLHTCLQFNHFEGYTTQPVLMSLKPWDKKELEQYEEVA